METYSSADLSIGIFITIAVLIFRFIIKQSQKKSTSSRKIPSSPVSEFVSTSEEAIAQMLGEFKSKEQSKAEGLPVNTTELELEEEELDVNEGFKRGDSYRIKQKKRSKGAHLIDSKEELRRAVILQEILSPPLSKR